MFRRISERRHVKGDGPMTNEIKTTYERTEQGLSLPSAQTEAAQAILPHATLAASSPLWSYLWHLQGGAPGQSNTGTGVAQVWSDYTGKGVRIGIIDEGFDVRHGDLTGRFNLNRSFDPRDAGTVSILPDTAAQVHGTWVAGVIGANGTNSYGVVGSAYEAELVGYFARFSGGSTRSEITGLLSRQVDVDVSNNSWGYTTAFSDNFRDPIWAGMRDAISNAAANGRDGLGTVFVFAAGNDRQFIAGNAQQDGDNTNSHSLTNSRFVVTVAASTADGKIASFSTPGASILVTAPGQDILTTSPDNGDGNAQNDFAFVSGTSFAAPQVSGIVALMLEANPNLGYRDVQEILALSAQRIDPSSPSWDMNGATNWNGGGLRVSHDFGFGLIDAVAAVRLAETWLTQRTAANEEVIRVAGSVAGNGTLVDNVARTYTVAVGPSHGDFSIDWVEVDIDLLHTHVGDLVIELVSPSGTVSRLVDRPGAGTNARDNINFTFSTTHNWNESPVGNWTLRVLDAGTGGTGTVVSFALRIYGDREGDNDTYFYTNDFDQIDKSSQTLSDGAGLDTINAAAVSSSSVLNLNPGAQSTIDGRSVVIAGGTIIENAFTGDGDDIVIGNAAANWINGGRGNDHIVGGDGSDQLEGGLGDDTLDGGAGLNSMDGGGGDDIVIGGNDADIMSGGGGNDALYGYDGADRLDGGDGDDFLWGGAGADQISGGEGADVVRGDGGDDTISGGIGNDTLAGEGGNDVIDGGDGDDIASGGDGNDVVAGGNGNDTLNGNAGDDILRGNEGDDQLYGHAAADNLDGGSGNDFLWGGGDNDILTGGDGDDRIHGDLGDDTIVGGDGADMLVGEDGNDIISGDSGNDQIYGYAGNDQLRGGEGADFVWGGTGDDTIEGGVGNDTLLGADGNDDVSGGEGNDIIAGEDGDDLLRGGSGDDAIYAHDGIDRLEGGDGNDIAWGGGGNDVIDGGAGDDYLLGAEGDDQLFGQDGLDILWAGSGNDLLDGGAGNDLLIGLEGRDVIRGGAGDDLAVGGADDDEMYGDLGNDRLVGDDGDDLVVGGAGDDVLAGVAGNDRLYGDEGSDHLLGGAGDDVVEGGAGNDTLAGEDGNDVIRGGDGNDALYAHDGDDVMHGDAGDDSLWAGAGADVLSGGDGNDILLGDAGDDTLDGGAGIDIITGGAGNDLLRGGAGHDVFIFRPGDGVDRILDFSAVDPDYLTFQGFGFSSRSDLLAAAQQVGSDVVIDLGSTVVHIHGTNLAALDACLYIA